MDLWRDRHEFSHDLFATAETIGFLPGAGCGSVESTADNVKIATFVVELGAIEDFSVDFDPLGETCCHFSIGCQIPGRAG
jgi:hypothetical protein